MVGGIVVTAIGCAAALLTFRRTDRWPYAAAKALAAAGFIWVAVSAGVPEHPAQRLLVAGLALSAIGDVALAFSTRSAFLVGLGAFALAHVAYSAGFIARGIAVSWLVVAGIVIGAASTLVWRRLARCIEKGTSTFVLAYVLVASVMVSLAWGSYGSGGPLVAAIGASAFYLSDLAVARERFFTHDPSEKLWGLPLYYAGQVLIALAARP